jgi:putative intracellular protease/amidase
MSTMGPAILIAHGVPGDALHDRVFELAGARPLVAWVGAANDDSLPWFERAATVLRQRYGADMRRVMTSVEDDSQRLVDEAAVIYLPGGDVSLLSQRLRALGLDERIRHRHAAGALVVGVSAGAIGLTRFWVEFPEDGRAPYRIPCVGALGLAVDCHDEQSDWEELRALLEAWQREEPGAVVDAYGIPLGGALEIAAAGTVTHLGPAPKWLRLDGGRIVE